MTTPILTVHRSAHQIGGNCIEIAYDGHRVLLDAGNPLDAPRGETPLPETLDTSRPVDAVIVSHPHQDHYGLLQGLPESWPVFCGAPTESLMKLTAAISHGNIPQTVSNYESFKPFSIGPFTLTPFLTDHSAFDAHMILVDVGGKRFLYSGDFRRTGRKQKLVERMLKHPPKNVDVLLLEGTTLSRDEAFPAEADLEDKFVELLQVVPGRVFITWSAQNIDRTVTIYRACKKSGCTLVLDIYTLDVLKRLGEYSAHIPQLDWKEVYGVFTKGLIFAYKEETYMNRREFVTECYNSRKVFGASLIESGPRKSVIMLRDTLLRDYEKKGVVLCSDDAWIFSMWGGYFKEQKYKDVYAKFKQAGARIESVHTSGHASRKDLQEFAASVDARYLVPIHSFDWDEYKNEFNNVKRLQDGEVFAV